MDVLQYVPTLHHIHVVTFNIVKNLEVLSCNIGHTDTISVKQNQNLHFSIVVPLHNINILQQKPWNTSWYSKLKKKLELGKLKAFAYYP